MKITNIHAKAQKEIIKHIECKAKNTEEHPLQYVTIRYFPASVQCQVPLYLLLHPCFPQ